VLLATATTSAEKLFFLNEKVRVAAVKRVSDKLPPRRGAIPPAAFIHDQIGCGSSSSRPPLATMPLPHRINSAVSKVESVTGAAAAAARAPLVVGGDGALALGGLCGESSVREIRAGGGRRRGVAAVDSWNARER
jgi:hypothetical protein